MLTLELSRQKRGALKVLCLGAHSDDIEIGCGGTILRLAEEVDGAEIYWVVFAASGQRAVEAKDSGTSFLESVKQKKIVIKDFRDGFFPYIGIEIKEYFEKLKNEFEPDVIFTHYRNDLHQDHRVISDLTWNTFRDHLILEYEIPKYDGDLGTPNLFVHLSESLCQKKIAYILRNFKSQRKNHWFNEQTFFSILRLRGIESNAPENYAEAFYCRKIVF
jgi:LmbE family N-acetylglucosaminyl deacetylase